MTTGVWVRSEKEKRRLRGLLQVIAKRRRLNIKLKCKECGKNFYVHRTKRKNTAKYCSDKCRRINLPRKNIPIEERMAISIRMMGDGNPCWNNGASFKPYPLGWGRTHREQIRYRDGYKCQLCGVPEAECNCRLHVHHIDYNKNNIKQENLVSLCINCHVKTNFNRKKWQKQFQKKFF